MSEQQHFQEIVKLIRNDLKLLSELYSNLSTKLVFRSALTIDEQINQDIDIKEWAFDVFLDKAYDVNAKIKRFFEDSGHSFLHIQFERPIEKITEITQKIALHAIGLIDDYRDPQLIDLFNNLREYQNNFEKEISEMRKKQYDTNWKGMKGISGERYILTKNRARYINSRGELKKAKEAVEKKDWQEVLNHLRLAIDLAIKEKFGFKRIQPMKQFIKKADSHNFPLPAYTMLYDYFDEGSQRIHGGRLNTPWECQRALSFVTEFIERLDLIKVSTEQIEDFKNICSAVE